MAQFQVAKPKVGDLYALKHHYGDNEVGAVGFCFAVQEAREEVWSSFIFPTGDHFKIRDDYLDDSLESVGECSVLAGYEAGVTEAMLMADFKTGVFDPALKGEHYR